MPTAYTKRFRIVVPAGKLTEARAAAKVVDPVGGSGAFSLGLIPQDRSPSDPPPTHYACDWQLTPEQATTLQAELSSRGVGAFVYELTDKDPLAGAPSLATILAERGLKRIGGPEA